MNVVSDTEAAWDDRPPSVVRATGFLVLSLPIRVAQFVLVVALAIVGIATTVVWVGVPILMAATSLVYYLGDHERQWVHRMLGVRVPRPSDGPDRGGAPFRRWLATLTERATWRYLAYLLIVFPLGVIEFVIGACGIVLVPVGLWVSPWVAWLHGKLAMALLGPSESERLAAKAARLRASRARGVDAAESERRRIEQDLHDGAQQRMVTVAMTLGQARSKFAVDPEEARTLIDEAHADAKLAVSELRDLARGIYPSVLGDRGLDAALSALAAKSPVPVEVAVDQGLVEQRPPQAVETCAYFIVGEALANIAKHAGAQQAKVTVSRRAATVIVEVTDDGRGGAELQPGGGLAGLADRAATIDGVVTVVSPRGGPTVIRADLPCAW
ncbi:sensor histidine kinase [Haloechinothrix salitolerans]|uniref:histidine kinase n=1 Tax=Haloechinothrix salitolerans TaxID=926830 RepID=A0ABW2C4T0_9PSEU